MRPGTRTLWEAQNRHGNDRRRMFEALRTHLGDVRVLYPGSYVDVAASQAFTDVTYVDVDKRAARFFADTSGVAEIVGPQASVRFLHADYTDPLDLPEAGFDLLVSLYAGPVSEHCTRYLRVGGYLLANGSHGDAALASIDPRYRLAGIVLARSGTYRVKTDALHEFMVPKQEIDLTRRTLLERGRGIAYTRPAFAYLFERVG